MVRIGSSMFVCRKSPHTLQLYIPPADVVTTTQKNKNEISKKTLAKQLNPCYTKHKKNGGSENANSNF